MKKHLAVALLACAASILPARAAPAWRGDTPFLQSSSFAPALSVQAPQRPDAPSGAAGRPAADDGATASANKWSGMVGGILSGLGLGALLSQLGIGGMLGGMVALVLVVALVAVMLAVMVRLVRRTEQDLPPMREPVLANSHAAAGASQPGPGMRAEPRAMSHAGAATGREAASWGVPADFDVPGFLRNAKAYFIRLQASWDRSDVNDIREFATAEMFAELSLQLQERGATHSQTQVAILNADLLGVESTGTDYVASVKFSGMIKESGQPMAEPFIEIWSLSRPVAGQGSWLLAGIQQLQ